MFNIRFCLDVTLNEYLLTFRKCLCTCQKFPISTNRISKFMYNIFSHSASYNYSLKNMMWKQILMEHHQKTCVLLYNSYYLALLMLQHHNLVDSISWWLFSVSSWFILKPLKIMLDQIQIIKRSKISTWWLDTW